MLIKLKCLKCGEEFIDDNKFIYVCCNKEMERSLLDLTSTNNKKYKDLEIKMEE